MLPSKRGARCCRATSQRSRSILLRTLRKKPISKRSGCDWSKHGAKSKLFIKPADSLPFFGDTLPVGGFSASPLQQLLPKKFQEPARRGEDEEIEEGEHDCPHTLAYCEGSPHAAPVESSKGSGVYPGQEHDQSASAEDIESRGIAQLPSPGEESRYQHQGKEHDCGELLPLAWGFFKF